MSHQRIAKLDVDKKQVFGWAYMAQDKYGQLVIDKSGEFVDDPVELESAAYHFVLHSRGGGVNHAKDDAGAPIIKSTLIESIVFTPEKLAAMGISNGSAPQSAWWVGFQVEDDAVWERVKSGELGMFSVHGKGQKKEVD